MVETETLLTLLLNGVAFSLGLVGNLHIVVVYLLDWCKRKSMASSDKIVCFVGLLNIALSCALTIDNVFYYTWREFYSQHSSLVAFFIIQMFLYFCSLWVTAWLCVFYCVKVVNNTNPVCLQLKLRISYMVPWLLVFSVGASLLTSIPVGVSLQKGPPDGINCSTTNGSWGPSGTVFSNGSRTISESGSLIESRNCNETGIKSNSVIGSPIYRFNDMGPLVVSILECSLPFTMVLVSCILLLWSLFSHAKKMETNPTVFQSHHMDTHIGAARTVISLLILYASFYLSCMAILSGIVPPSGFYNVLCYLTAVMYPAAHSLILIFGSSRLKHAYQKAFRHVRCQTHKDNTHSITE